MKEKKMGTIEVIKLFPKCRRSSMYTSEYSDMPMSIKEIKTHLQSGYDIAIYVDGWSKPWKCFIDVNTQLRAQCPTNTKTIPRVIQTPRGDVIYNKYNCEEQEMEQNNNNNNSDDIPWDTETVAYNTRNVK